MNRRFDYLVVGSGLAGLYAALRASAYGTVGLLTKSGLTESNSYHAQGGIAAVTDKDDYPRYHFDDTVTAGRGLCDAPAVDILVNEGPDRIREIVAEGMRFDVGESGELALGLEGGHHRRRILHAGGDATGMRLTSFVLEQVRRCPSVSLFADCALFELLVTDGVCDGVRAWDETKEEEVIFLAGHTILATGGSAALYNRTTNPGTTTGDGAAVAWQAGCSLEDMEFIQFHPTALVHPQAPGFLISEAVRGEGARLLNLHGERFMAGAHELAELAPRDVVAQHIDRQIRREGKGYVWLSLSHLDPQAVRSRFPTICAKCAELGIDMTDRIPVAPAAHYTVGGVRTDACGRTELRHLYVCGELASTGIMGANRLASNSLIECLVFGRRAVEDTLPGHSGVRTESLGDYIPASYADPEAKAACGALRSEVSALLSEYAGIVRTAAGLRTGLAGLDRLEALLPDGIREDGRREVWTRISRNLLLTARLIMQGALYREESRGCHYREDFPAENERFRVHTVQRRGRPMEELAVVESGEIQSSRRRLQDGGQQG